MMSSSEEEEEIGDVMLDIDDRYDVSNSSNVTRLLPPGRHLDTAAHTYAVLVLYLVTFVFGISGNTITIVVLCKKGLRSAASCFILNLAVADDLFVVCLPLSAYSTFVHRWDFGMYATNYLFLAAVGPWNGGDIFGKE